MRLNKRSYIRLAGMRCLLRGISRANVGVTFCCSECMVRMWIVKYNQGSIDPLLSRPKGGRKREISLQRLEDMLVPVLKDPQQAAVGHWTDVKVHGWLQQQFQIELSYSTVVCYLHDLDLHLHVPRPWPLPLLDEPEREEQR